MRGLEEDPGGPGVAGRMGEWKRGMKTRTESGEKKNIIPE